MYLDGPHSIKPIVEYLNKSRLEAHYIVLISNYENGRIITAEMIAQLTALVKLGTVHINDMLVKGSRVRLQQRADDVSRLMKEIVEQQAGRYL
jgi:Mg2+/Co2+ transporter CorC